MFIFVTRVRSLLALSAMIECPSQLHNFWKSPAMAPKLGLSMQYHRLFNICCLSDTVTLQIGTRRGMKQNIHYILHVVARDESLMLILSSLRAHFSLLPFIICSFGDMPGSVTPSFWRFVSAEIWDFLCTGKARLESRGLENEDVTTSGSIYYTCLLYC